MLVATGRALLHGRLRHTLAACCGLALSAGVAGQAHAQPGADAGSPAAEELEPESEPNAEAPAAPSVAEAPEGDNAEGENAEGESPEPEAPVSETSERAEAIEPSATNVPQGEEERIGEAVMGEAPRRPNAFDRRTQVRDPRELALDTSDAVYIPEEAHVPDEVVTIPPPGVGFGDDPSRRTQARTQGRVTVLSNIADAPVDAIVANEPSVESDVSPSPEPHLAARTELTRRSLDTQQLPLRAAAVSPSPNGTSGWTWLWALSGVALVLLLPIAMLLTRPTRKG